MNGDTTQTLITISAAIGFFMPVLIAALNREKWGAHIKAASAFVLCLAAGLLIVWWQGMTNWQDYRVSSLTVLTSALGFYHMFWKPSGAADAISKTTG